MGQRKRSFQHTDEHAQMPRTDGAATSGGTPESGEDRQVSKWAVMIVVAIGVFMATLDSSIVNISLPAIAHYFNVPLNGAVEWVVIAYLVTTAAVLLTPLPITIAFIAPLSGSLADRIGTRWLASVGLAIACIGLVSPLSVSLPPWSVAKIRKTDRRRWLKNYINCHEK